MTNQKVYFREVTDTEVLEDYPNPEAGGFSLVYDGDVTLHGNEWQGVILDTPFSYSGTDNLQIVWENHHGQWSNDYPTFYLTEGNPNVCSVNMADGAFPTESGMISNFFPNLILSFYAENEPDIITYTFPANNTLNVPVSTTLEWTIGENTTDIDLYFSSSKNDVRQMNPTALVIDAEYSSSYIASDLELSTDYFWRVNSRNVENGLVVRGPIWRFSTEAGPGIVATAVGEGTETNNSHPWNFYYQNSVAQTIYLAEEINMGGSLTNISFFNNFVTDIGYKPVTVWVGETDQTSLINYIPASELTEVFSGIVNFPAGENTINIPLETAYTYSGGNLVVLTGRLLDNQAYSPADRFYHTETDLENRTIYWKSDTADFDPYNMTVNPTRTNNMTNSVLYFDVAGTGSVSGTVSDGVNGISGVRISINETNHSTYSLEDGSFNFPYVRENENYVLTASRIGYQTGTATFDVIENEETIVNVEIQIIDNVTVSGQVITNDTGLGIEAEVTLTGSEIYQVTTDNNGIFSIPGVFANESFAGLVQADSYEPAIFQVTVGNQNLDLGTIMVTEKLYPTSNVIATIEDNNALISWDVPLQLDGLDSFSDNFEQDLSQWHEIIEGDGYVDFDGYPYWHIGTPDTPYDGNSLNVNWGYDIDTWAITPNIITTSNTSINFEFTTNYDWFVDPYDNGDLSVKISEDGENWTEVWCEDDIVFNNWQWVNVNIPLSEYAGQSLQVAFHLTGSDNADLYIDNLYIGDSRNGSTFVVANPSTKIDSDAKTYKSGGISYTFTNRERTSVTKTFDSNSRALESYNIYRFLVEDQTEMQNWVLIGEEISELNYLDIEWSNLATGFYRYAVTAVYTSGVESKDAKSNWLEKSSLVEVAINVESNIGEMIGDANITLVSLEANPSGEYAIFNGETDASGTTSITVTENLYNIRVFAYGYAGYAGEVDATNDTVVNVVLNEIAFPAVNVVAQLEGNNAVITWDEPDGTGAGEWISKSSEISQDGIGLGSAATMDVAHKYTQAELDDYQGMYLKNIKFLPREANGTYTVKVWGGEDGNTELYSQEVGAFTNNSWNNCELNSSIAIPSSGPLFIGYSVYTEAGYPCGCDAGPAVPGGDMVKINNQPDWEILSESTSINANWNIQAYVSWSDRGEVASQIKILSSKDKLTNSSIISSSQLKYGNLGQIANRTPNTRGLENYDVYRLLLEDEDNMENWELLLEGTTDLTYIDEEWSELTSAFYKYGIVSVYSNNVVASPAISNWLQQSETSLVTINVISNLSEVIADAHIKLIAQEANPDGEYEQYEINADNNGMAEVTVNNGFYDIIVTAPNFLFKRDVVDATTDTAIYIILNELALPPTEVIAEVNNSEVNLTWGDPSTNSDSEWITKGSEDNATGIGIGARAIISVAQMYSEAELFYYQEMYISAIKFFPRVDNALYTVKVWGGEDGNVEVYSQDVPTIVNETWNEVSLDFVVPIPAVGPLYFGYVADTPSGYPCGADAGPALPGGDLIKLNNQPNWDSLSEVSDIELNWNVQARLSWNRDARVVSDESRRLFYRENPTAIQSFEFADGNLQPIVLPTSSTTRELEGYRVWRLTTAYLNDESNWVSLTENPITDLYYTDISWNGLEAGEYRYAVKAIYSNNNLSQTSFSNKILKDMHGTVDGIVMGENNTPISGATINLASTTTTTDALGYFLFTNILEGDYQITASAEGYNSSTQTISVVGNQVTEVNFIMTISNVIFSDSFETYPNFSLEAGTWTMVDGDLSTTYGIQGYMYDNSFEPMAYIIFNPTATVPPLEDNLLARTGDKYIASFAATDGPNNDWIITEPITLADSGTFSFWAKSAIDTYDLEQFNILVSTGSTEISDFNSISGSVPINAPLDWTNFSYDLDDYSNQTIRIAIQCVSNDKFVFMVDDVEVDAPGITYNEDNEVIALSSLKGNYPNPFNPETTIAFSTKESGHVSLNIYNIKGQKVRTLINDNRKAGKHTVIWNGKDDSGKSVASGVFFYKMKAKEFTSTKKMILMK